MLAVLAIALIAPPAPLAAAQGAASDTLVNTSILRQDLAEMLSIARNLSSLGSRVVGYPGFYAAEKLIKSYFSGVADEVVVQNFTLAVPVDEGTYVVVGGRRYPAYALWPNGPVTCSTPPSGVSGPLVYVGEGSLSELDGHVINGSILLMEFNSGDNWRLAAQFGAKGVIFIEPPYTDEYEALKKAIPIPVHFPRAYVDSKVGDVLRKYAANHSIATLHVNMRWRQVRASNIIGIIRGTEYPNDVVVVCAHYDSWSVVPSKSPGTQDALGVSALLTLAKYFSRHRPRRTLWFVAISGYWEGLAGAVEFVERNLYSSANLNGSTKIWLVIGLSFSTDSPGVDVLYTGFGTGFECMYSQFLARYARLVSMLSTFVEDAKQAIKRLNIDTEIPLEQLVNLNFRARMDWGTQPTFYMLNIEPVVQTGTLAIELRTQYKVSEGLTPLNDFPEVSAKAHRLLPQLIVAMHVIEGFANTENWPLSWSDVRPRRLQLVPQRLSFITLKGRTVTFNLTKGWYTPLPHVLVRLERTNPNTPDYWPFTCVYNFSDSGGNFVFHGLYTGRSWSLNGFILNDTTGMIEYTVDFGMYGAAQGVAGGIANSVTPISHPVHVLLPLFRCKQLTLFGLFDTSRLTRAVIPDMRQPGLRVFYAPTVPQIGVYDKATRSIPLFYSIYQALEYTEAVVFAPPGSRIIVTFNPEQLLHKKPLIVLVNNSEANPEGYGYCLRDHVTVYNTVYRAALELYRLSVYRFRLLKSHYVYSPIAEDYLEKARHYLELASRAFKELNYSRGYAYSIAALALVGKAYSGGVMPLYDWASNALLFFQFLAIPFALIASLVLCESYVWRGVVGSLLLAALMYLYSVVNPSFSVVSSVVMCMMGVAVFLMFLYLVYMLGARGSEALRAAAIKRMGMHEFRRGTLASSFLFVTTAIMYMKKRRLLSTLTLLQVVASIVALTAFSSLAPVNVVKTGLVVMRTGITHEEALAIKGRYGMPPDVMDRITVDMLQGLAGEDFYVAPRCVYYPVPTSSGLFLVLSANNRTVSILNGAVVGVSPIEYHRLLGSATEGESLYWTPPSVILPDSIARRLNVTVGDEVEIRGIGRAVVTGILWAHGQRVIDLDGFNLMPVRPTMSFALSYRTPAASAQRAVPAFISLSDAIFMPWQRVLRVGGYVMSVALIPKRPGANLTALGRELSYISRFPVYIKEDDRSITLSLLQWYKYGGFTAVLVVLIITALAILNTMLHRAQVERNDIFVYSALGLPPSGGYIMFLTESLVYAVSGATIGLLAGLYLNKVMLDLGLLPPEFKFNFSGSFILLSVGVIIVTIFLSSIYPARMVSRIITPSLERKWKPPTKPRGDVWQFTLPVSFSPSEALGFLVFLDEYFRGSGAATANYRVLEDPVLDLSSRLLRLKVKLAPFEVALAQEVMMNVAPMDKEGRRVVINVTLRRTLGNYRQWVAGAYKFTDDIRKQMLVWRSLSPREQRKYVERARTYARGSTGGSGAAASPGQ